MENSLGMFKRLNVLQTFLIIALSLSWFPLLRFGFDPHHDGLIVSTVNNIRLGSGGNNDWPFNQYGPAWFLLLKVITSQVSSDWIFLSLRIITLLFYFLTFLFSFILARKFLDRTLSLFALFFLMVIQPFASDFNSDMIPWPSALSMAIIPLAAWLLICAKEQNLFHRKLISVLCLSAAVTIVTLTRVQVGILLTLLVGLILVAYRQKQQLIIFLLSLFAQYSIILLYLVKMNWLDAVFSDVFKFGSLYVTGDRSTFPRPTWTIILVILFLIIFEIGVRVRLSEIANSKSLKLAVIFLSFLGVSAMVLLARRGLTPTQYLSVGFRRIWIALLLAVVISTIVKALLNITSNKKLPSFKLATLILFSAAAEIQVWPLFDQMHAWWASTPAVILLVSRAKKVWEYQEISFPSTRISLLTVILALTLTYTITFLSSISHERVPLNIKGYSGILLSEKDGNEIFAVNKFLESKITQGGKVLNLCTNGDPFFVPSTGISSAARAFVFWSPMVRVPSLISNIQNSSPTTIVTCSFVTNPIFLEEYQSEQAKLLKPFLNNFQLTGKFMSPKGVSWRVYSKLE